jgi:tetratricopeptide (TPR) repeat protein
MNRERRVVVLAALAVAALAIWIHLPCIHNQFLDWDDDVYLDSVAPHLPLSFGTVAWAFKAFTPFYYHPLTWLSQALDCQLWGFKPAGHHLMNVLLHGANSALVLWLAWLLADGVRKRIALAIGVAVVFAIHPLQVESVAWVAERKNVLCGLFFLASLCAYVHHVKEPQRRAWFWATVALSIAAFLSKPMAVSLPFVMLTMDFYPLRRIERVGWRRLLIEKWWLFAGCLALAAATIVPQAKIEAMRGLASLTVWERFFVAMRGSVFYLWKLVWPAWLSPYYPLGDVHVMQREFLVPLAVFAAITALSFWTQKTVPAILAAWAAYLALILPVSGLLQSGAQAAADRFMYLAMVPMLLLFASGFVWLWRRANIAVRIALVVLLVGEAVFFGLRSREQMAVWHDRGVFWRTVLTRYPQSGVANLHYATLLNEEFRFSECIPHAQQAVKVLSDEALPHAELGLAYLKTHKFQEAANELQEALRQEPDLVATRYNLACAYCRLGQLAEAYETLQELLRNAPQFAQAAARDSELSALRQDPEYGPRLQSLIQSLSS